MTWALSQLRQSPTKGSRNVVEPVLRAEIRTTEKAMCFEHVEASCISDESMPWMSLGLAPGVEVKFFKADPIRGEVIALLKAPAEAKLPRHRHSGTPSTL